MEDILKCQISPLVKYRQNQTYTAYSAMLRYEWNVRDKRDLGADNESKLVPC